jgi:hypothetical protein
MHVQSWFGFYGESLETYATTFLLFFFLKRPNEREKEKLVKLRKKFQKFSKLFFATLWLPKASKVGKNY